MGSEREKRLRTQVATPVAPVDSPMGAFFAGASQRVPEDLRVPGKSADHTAAWVDEKDHVATTDQQEIAEAHAISEAAVLALSMKDTGDRDARHHVLDALDRVDDPETRRRMLSHYKGITHETLETSIETASWHGKRDKEQALDLISPQRDAADMKLASLTPAEKAKLEQDAEGWARRVLAVTRPDDANDDANARDLINVLGPLQAHEIEAVRSAIRAQTGGKSLYGEIDRSLSGDNEDAAVAALKGDPVYSATIALTTANGDPKAVRDTLSWMSPEQIAEMKARAATVGMDTDWIAGSVPENRRAEVQALVDAKMEGTGKNAAADGEHIGELFGNPYEGMTAASIHDKNKLGDLKTHTASNIIDELRDMSPEQIRSARAAWEAAHPGTSWASLADRYRDGDANTYLRIQALMAGDKVGEKAYALRAAMGAHDQAGIEAALASPDLDADATTEGLSAEQQQSLRMRKAVAHAERLALMGRVRDLDAHDRQATAAVTGASPIGRTLEQQLEDSHANYISSAPEIHDMESAFHVIGHVTDSKNADERRARVHDDRIATREMLQDGKLSVTTRIHRARQAGDTKGESKLLQGIATGDELRDVRLDYLATYDERLFRGLDEDRVSFVAGMVSDSDEDTSLMRHRLAMESESTEELRIRQIGERGVFSERSTADQLADQRAINDKTWSGDLQFHEEVRRRVMGGNYGTQDLMQAGYQRASSMVDAKTGKLREGVSPEQFARANETLVASQELQGEAKQKLADESAAALGTMIRLAALLAPGAYPLLNLTANLTGMAVKGSVEGADYTQQRQNADWLQTGVSSSADLLGMGAGKLAAVGKISEVASTVIGTTAQVGGAMVTSAAAGDSSEQTGIAGLNVVLGSLLPILGKSAGGLISGTSGLARIARGVVGTGVQSAGAYALNGGGGDLLDAADAVGGAAGDQLGGHSHAHQDHANARSHSREPVHASEHPHPRKRNVHVVANGHYAEDGPHAEPHVHDDDAQRREHPHALRDERESQPRARSSNRDHNPETATATARRRAKRAAETPPTERARRESYIAEHGHPGTDLHSHFMGVPSVDDFAAFMGKGTDGKGAPISREEMLDKMVSAVRNDGDYQKHYSVDDAGNKVFDYTGGGIHKTGGHAFDNVRTIEAAHAEIADLRKQPSTPENEAQIAEIAERAVDDAMNSGQNTPYDGAYSIRDTLVKAYIDPQEQGKPAQPYRNFTRMTIEALARDGVLYSEQSQSVKKLSQGNVPADVVREELAKVNKERASRGEPPIDVRFLAMIETRFLGAEGSESAGGEADWAKQLDAVRGMLKRGDVMGVDVASPETSEMSKVASSSKRASSNSRSFYRKRARKPDVSSRLGRTSARDTSRCRSIPRRESGCRSTATTAASITKRRARTSRRSSATSSA